MVKRKWLWKRRSSLDKSTGESETSGSMSSQSEKCSEDQECTKGSPNQDNQSPEVTPNTPGDKCNKENQFTSKNSLLKKLSEADQEDFLEKNNSTVEATLDEATSTVASTGKEENETVNLLKEKLSAALINVSLKDELVNQHIKVAEDAVEGWEKAENEAASLKQQLDTATEQNSSLDQALKECVRQLRLSKEEEERKISESLSKKSNEYELSKSNLESQIIELQSKLEFLERENQSLKHDLVAQSEELEIRTIERDLSTKAAETASKQQLESIKMVAKIESECRKLKGRSLKSPSVMNKSLSSSSSVIMDDFLEMEKLAAMPEKVVLLIRADELEEKVRRMEAEKVELEGEVEEANELKMDYESHANDLKLESEAMVSKIEQLQEEVDRQRVSAEKLSDRCQELENELDEKEKALVELQIEIKEGVIKLENREETSRIELDDKETALGEIRKCLEELQIKVEEAEMKLGEKVSALTKSQSQLEKMKKEVDERNESIEHELSNARGEVATMSTQIDTLQALIDKENGISAQLSAKCEELVKELNQKERELELWKNAPAVVEHKINQEDLTNAAGKLAECQKTIASLGNQLKSLATLEDFLIDTASIPAFSGSAPLIPKGGSEPWKLHSNNDVYLPQKRRNDHFQDPEEGLHTFSKYVDGDVIESSPSSSTDLSGKRGNGFEKLFPMRKG